jgi:DNA-directed RNA polymerase subunit RPC12/RpoP
MKTETNIYKCGKCPKGTFSHTKETKEDGIGIHCVTRCDKCGHQHHLLDLKKLEKKN